MLVDLKDLNVSEIIFETLDVNNGYIYSNILLANCKTSMKVINVTEDVIQLEFLPHQNNEYQKMIDIEAHVIDYFSTHSNAIMGTQITKGVMASMLKPIIHPPKSLDHLPYIKLLCRNPVVNIQNGYIVDVELTFDKVLFQKNYFYIIGILNNISVISEGGGSSRGYSNTSDGSTDTSISTLSEES